MIYLDYTIIGIILAICTVFIYRVYNLQIHNKNIIEDLKLKAQLLDAATDSIFLTEPGGKLVYSNEKGYNALGYTKTEIMQINMLTLIPQEYLETVKKGIIDLMEKGETVFESAYIRKDLSVIPVELHSRVVLTSSGRLILNIAHDLSRRRKIENDIESTQKQLLQSEKLASIGQLAAGIAHEINNPIGFISSNISTLKNYISSFKEAFCLFDECKRVFNEDDKMSMQIYKEKITDFFNKSELMYMLDDTHDLITESQEGIEHIKKIISDLRTFVRKDEGIKAVADVNTVIDSVINIVWNEIKYKSELKKEYKASRNIEGNIQQIGQVLINILINAAQAIKEKGIISIKTYDKNDKVYIEISDTGTGIPQDIIDKIFDPFFTTKEVGKGTGLGLSISYDIVKRHHGTIIVCSEVGKGTTFTLTFPSYSQKNA